VATQPTITCDFCSSSIPRTDFELGRATTLMKKNYCSACLAAAIDRSKREDYIPQFLTPRPGSLHSPLRQGRSS
jgi:hypothetical protein